MSAALSAIRRGGGWTYLVLIALAVTANLKVSDIVESLLVHPALAEALAEAAE